MNKDNKKFVIETIFLQEALKHDLTIAEFLILVYFDNDYDQVFDVKKIMKATCLKEEDVLIAFDSLLNKGIITLSSSKNESGKIYDKVSLENLYKDIKSDSEPKDNPEDFMVTFQKNYGHNLTSMDFELIKAWLDSGFSEELILGALQEAIYNKVYSLKYIDKILFTWKKKGLNTMKDVNNHLMRKDGNDEDEPKFETSVMEFDWLDDEE